MIDSHTALSATAWTALILSFIGYRLIDPHNRLPSRLTSADLPIKSLPPKPILQIELGRTEQGLEQILNPPGTSPDSLLSNLQHARRGNTLDTFLFIPSYTIFLMSLGILLARASASKLILLAALIAVPMAALCDWTENAGISATLNHFEADHRPHQGDAVRIADPSTVKWTLLALTLIIYGIDAVLTRQPHWIAIGVLCTPVGLLIGYTLAKYFWS
jgi:uncharacterized membrane protein